MTRGSNVMFLKRVFFSEFSDVAHAHIVAILNIFFRIKIMYFVFKLLIFLLKSILFQLNVLFLHLFDCVHIQLDLPNVL
jgi:hypothetical protein